MTKSDNWIFHDTLYIRCTPKWYTWSRIYINLHNHNLGFLSALWYTSDGSTQCNACDTLRLFTHSVIFCDCLCICISDVRPNNINSDTILQVYNQSIIWENVSDENSYLITIILRKDRSTSHAFLTYNCACQRASPVLTFMQYTSISARLWHPLWETQAVIRTNRDLVYWKRNASLDLGKLKGFHTS